MDPRSGYRHYSVAQVPVAQAIRRLRDLGMPLEDIGTVVHASDVGARNAAIAAHLGRMEGHLEETRATVASLRALPEGGSATIAVEYRRLPRATTIAIGEEIVGADMHAWLDQAFGELRAAVEALGCAAVMLRRAVFERAARGRRPYQRVRLDGRVGTRLGTTNRSCGYACFAKATQASEDAGTARFLLSTAGASV